MRKPVFVAGGQLTENTCNKPVSLYIPDGAPLAWLMHHILVYHPVIAVWHINTGAEVLRMTQLIVMAIIRPGVILLALRH